ncbi:hypothetical protein L226DRAFT_537351 [Lentinus tigrinus ALCF2SS1-7]|uniref:Uncharacterized protein n=1 Tax=Lentinus tigrinus ALCF2SS1-6 TaxID=1328759 RepID=A0A5C2S3J7_9APHY|nr:hypothetical protein L227DRAFT_655067 [Lentinus tigrinus ALCF2SS1-6]RPD72241.1 hypothetical protein L226DRAFT_537351 [Lentinus tigrinus ALCF2SS1-7]
MNEPSSTLNTAVCLSLVALHAHEESNCIYTITHHNGGCCNGHWELASNFPFERKTRLPYHPKYAPLLDALAVIISLHLGRRQVALIGDFQSVGSDVYAKVWIAADTGTPESESGSSNSTPTPTQSSVESDVDRLILRHLVDVAKTETTENTSALTGSEAKAELVAHAYRMCRAEIRKIMTRHYEAVQGILPPLGDVITQLSSEPDAMRSEGGPKIDLLRKVQRVFAALIAYLEADAPSDRWQENDVPRSLVLELHQSIVEIIPSLSSKADLHALEWTAVPDGFMIPTILTRASTLTQALDDITRQCNETGKGLREILARGILREWVPRPPSKATSVTIDETCMTELRSRHAILKDVSPDELIERLSKKPYITRVDQTTFEVTANTHCEVALINRFASPSHNRDLDIAVPSYVACALPFCFACHTLVCAMNEVPGSKQFQMGGPCNGVIDRGWQFPESLPHALEIEIKDLFIADCDVALERAIAEYYTKTQNYRRI